MTPEQFLQMFSHATHELGSSRGYAQGFEEAARQLRAEARQLRHAAWERARTLASDDERWAYGLNLIPLIDNWDAIAAQLEARADGIRKTTAPQYFRQADRAGRQVEAALRYAPGQRGRRAAVRVIGFARRAWAGLSKPTRTS